MNLELPETAVDFAAAAAHAVADAGGVDLARDAEVDPSIRTTVVAALLEGLGAHDMRLGVDLETDMAAAELCRVAGRSALPYPVAATLAGPDGPDRPVALVDPARPRVDHGDLFATWSLTDLAASAGWEGHPHGDPRATRLGPFVTEMTLHDGDGGVPDATGFVVLSAFQILGTLERAVELAVEHVSGRQQFDRLLAGFQSVQFQVADATVAVASLRELARATMWRRSARAADRTVDALALRVHALEAAVAVLRTCHQLHGAVGFCLEHDLSVLSRHAQPLLRVPAGLEETVERFAAAVATDGFETLFGRSAASVALSSPAGPG